MEWLLRPFVGNRHRRPAGPPRARLELTELQDRITPVVITNGLSSSTPGFVSADVQLGGTLLPALSPQGGLTNFVFTDFDAFGNLITQGFAGFGTYGNYVQVAPGQRGISLGADPITPTLPEDPAVIIIQQPTLISPNTVQSSGQFAGDRGQIITYVATTSLAQLAPTAVTTIEFSTDSTAGLGGLRFINFMEEGLGTAFANDLLRVGTFGNRVALTNLEPDTGTGISILGPIQNGPFVGDGFEPLQNGTYLGFQAGFSDDILTDVLNGTLTPSVTGNIESTLPPLNSPQFGQVFGPNDIGQALVYDFNDNATTSSVTVAFGFVSRRGTFAVPLQATGSGSNFPPSQLIPDLSTVFPTPATTGPVVNVFSPTDTDGSNVTVPLYSLNPFNPLLKGGARVATADVNGDYVDDIIVGAGPGGGPHVQVYDGGTGQLVGSFLALNPAFTGGVYVAGGDLNGDGFAEIIVSADAGGGPQVEVYDGVTGLLVTSFFAYPAAVSSGVLVASGDVNGDGFDDVATVPGVGFPSLVQVFDGRTLYATGNLTAALIGAFLGYDLASTGGAYIAVGDVVGQDGLADIVLGPGAFSFGQAVKAFDTANNFSLARAYLPYADQGVNSMFAQTAQYTSDLRVAVTTFIDPNNQLSVLQGISVATGFGAPTLVRVIDPNTDVDSGNLIVSTTFPFGPNYLFGAFVG